jgi:membrane protein
MNILKSIRDGASWLSQSVYVTLTIFFKKETQNHASGLALYFFLSAIPLVYFLNTVIAGNLELSKALYFLLEMLLLNFMDVDFSNSSDRYYGIFKVTSRVSIAVLLWGARGLMRSVHGAFSVIFAAPKRRSFISTNLIALMIIPFSFLALTIWVAGDYLDLLYRGSPFFSKALHLANLFTPIFMIWAICFLSFYFIPPARPGLRLAIATSFACALFIALLQFFTNTVFKVDQYIKIYGSLGAIIFALIWAYVISLTFLLCAEFLRVSGKIDVIAMERIFLYSEERGRLAARIEHFLFKRSERLFEKYGRFFQKDSVVATKHSDSSTIFYLYSGKIGIYEYASVRTGEAKEGELFGEVDHLLGRPFTSTYIAEADSFLFALSPEIFETLMNSSLKLSRHVIDSLSKAFPR